jgi:ABC-2 type transport system ATP-binding protein
MSAGPTPALEIIDLHVHFDDVRALDGITFELGSGRTLGLLGSNGAGKTTTISAILGLVLPTRGKVRALGVDMTTARHRALGRMNFSSPYVVFPARLSVHEVLRFYAGLYEVHRPGATIRELASTLEMTHLLKRRVAGLSAGQKTRVSLAKALLNRPDLLLLDEPTASLDPETKEWALDLIESFRAQTGCTIVLASHDMAEVQRLCTDIVVLGAGRVLERGTVDELLEKYQQDAFRQVFFDIAAGAKEEREVRPT